MKLTTKDRQYLLEKVYGGIKKTFEEDERQIVDATEATTYTLYKGETRGGKISRANAIALCGREGWLSGIARAAFHWTAMRDVKGKPNLFVSFDSHKLFN